MREFRRVYPKIPGGDLTFIQKGILQPFPVAPSWLCGAEIAAFCRAILRAGRGIAMEGRKNKEVLTFLLGIAREKRIHMGKKTDETDRQIRLLAEEREYRAMVLALAVWTP